MRVAVIGGGPAGLATAALLRRNGVAGEVVLWERERSKDAGFGVILPPGVQATATRMGAGVTEGLREASVDWRSMKVRRDGSSWSIPASPGLAAISRSAINAALWEACVVAGVRMRVGLAPALTAISRVFDLVVCADGAGSIAAATGFDVRVRRIGPPYVWLGLDEAVDSLEFTAQATAAGTYISHAYPYSPSASTFLVEGPRALSAAAVSALFSRSVRTAPGNGALHWRSFRERTVHPWSLRNVVLVGDAAHTAHYSIGYGTALALDDAEALVRALSDESHLESALGRYEAVRRPVVERAQERGRVSAHWFSMLDDHMDLPLEKFAASLLTRGGRLAELTATPGRQQPSRSRPLIESRHRGESS